MELRGCTLLIERSLDDRSDMIRDSVVTMMLDANIFIEGKKAMGWLNEEGRARIENRSEVWDLCFSHSLLDEVYVFLQ